MIFSIGLSGGTPTISLRDAAEHPTRDTGEIASLMNTDGE
ncbi:hypothetical protein Pan14r_17920 [Crateriforma conspicua]|uniref:Uncharacterized protein n=1 Tax=Crateriforma conspicua TaxID=2527996 RepID=A0A5C5Y2U3_9PLAN|nr:hypothetical protein Pan14r_17920 [Crateriforma conspicua]